MNEQGNQLLEAAQNLLKEKEVPEFSTILNYSSSAARKVQLPRYAHENKVSISFITAIYCLRQAPFRLY